MTYPPTAFWMDVIRRSRRTVRRFRSWRNLRQPESRFPGSASIRFRTTCSGSTVPISKRRSIARSAMAL